MEKSWPMERRGVRWGIYFREAVEKLIVLSITWCLPPLVFQALPLFHMAATS